MVLVTRASPPFELFLPGVKEFLLALPNQFEFPSSRKAGSPPSGTHCVPAPSCAYVASELLALLPASPANGESPPPSVARRRDSPATRRSVPGQLRQMYSGSKRRAHPLAMQ